MNNGSPHGFIPDGFTYDGYIAAVPRLHPAMSFRFRPIMQIDRIKAWIGVAQDDVQSREHRIAALLAKHVLEWDLRDPSRAAVDITPENMPRIHPMLYDRLYRIVTLEHPSDVPDRGDVETHTVDIQEQLGNSNAG